MKISTFVFALMLLVVAPAANAQGRGNGRGGGQPTPPGPDGEGPPGRQVVSVPDGDPSTATLLALGAIGVGGALVWSRRRTGAV